MSTDGRRSLQSSGAHVPQPEPVYVVPSRPTVRHYDAACHLLRRADGEPEAVVPADAPERVCADCDLRAKLREALAEHRGGRR